MPDPRAPDVPAFNLRRGRDASGLDKKSLTALQDEIRTVYTADARPWVLGYSGGKDSTTACNSSGTRSRSFRWSSAKNLSM